MTPNEAYETGVWFTSMLCIVPVGFMLFVMVLSIIGTYFRMGKLVKLMDEAVNRSRKRGQS